MAQRVHQGLTDTHAILLYKADDLRTAIEEFLLDKCGAGVTEVAGDYRRRVDVIEEMAFIIETQDLPALVSKLGRYGGDTPLLSSSKDSALFALASGILLRIQLASKRHWGLSLIASTGSKAHLRKLTAVTGGLKTLKSKGPFPNETPFYRTVGLAFIEPELREGLDEIEQAANGTLPVLVSVDDIRGELHAHSISSDGANSIEQMCVAARKKGYEYLGTTDHSQSLKIARGVSVEDLWKQIRFIDKLNERLNGFCVLKSTEVDILADGALRLSPIERTRLYGLFDSLAFCPQQEGAN